MSILKIKRGESEKKREGHEMRERRRRGEEEKRDLVLDGEI